MYVEFGAVCKICLFSDDLFCQGNILGIFYFNFLIPAVCAMQCAQHIAVKVYTIE